MDSPGQRPPPQPRPESASHLLTTKFVPHHVLSPPKYHPCPFPSPLSSMFCSVTDFWWLTGLLPILNSLVTWNPGLLLPNCKLLSGRGLCVRPYSQALPTESPQKSFLLLCIMGVLIRTCWVVTETEISFIK